MKKVLDGFAKVVEVLLVVLMTCMMIVVFLATVGRYTHLFSIAWSEEFARYCMIAIVYFGLMLASRTDSHFVVEIIPLLFAKKPGVIKAIALINAVITDIFGVFLFYEGYTVSAKMLKQGKISPMMSLPLGAVYMIIPIGILLMAIFYSIRTVERCMEKTEVKEAE